MSYSDDMEKPCPHKWEICSRCDGEGTQVHPAFSVWTSEDRAEDPEAFEAMMAGAYDIPCKVCGGTGKVKIHEDDGTCEEYDDYQERYNDARTRAMEMGDWEAYQNPEYLF